MKVYLCQSRAGSIVPIERVKEWLRGLGVEVVEFSGGSYDTEDEIKLTSSDIFLLLPPINVGQCIYSIGKGQYSELRTYYLKNGWDNMYIIDNIIDDKMCIGQFKGQFKQISENWKTNYGQVETPCSFVYNSDVEVNKFWPKILQNVGIQPTNTSRNKLLLLI